MSTSTPTSPPVEPPVEPPRGDDGPDTAPDLPSRPRAAVAGVLAAVAGLAAGELVAGLGASLRSPVVSIGNRVVDGVPRPVKDLAIAWFGTNDKLALVVGIVVTLVVVAAGLGILARRRPRIAAGAAAALGAVAVAAAAVDPTAVLPWSLLPGLATAAVAVPTLLWLVHGRVVPSDSHGDSHGGSPGADTTGWSGEPRSRRSFLVAAGSVAVASVAAAGAGRLLGRRFSVAGEREDLALPAPDTTAPAIPSGAGPDVDGLSPFVTDNDDFYRIDTALQVPQLSSADWTLRIHGMVAEEQTLTYADLLALPAVERTITMTCVSNEVGGDLVGTATWQGVRLADLLDRVGVDERADQVVGRAFDGWTAGFPVEAVADNEALVVYGMNGEPLPEVHGFPLRLVTPGLYGYVSATKWLSEIELTTFDAFDMYWVERGWDRRGPIKVQSRIDTPSGFDRVRRGDTVPVAGVAWAQTRGIEAVEVRVDDGEFQPAELAESVGPDTWRQWVWRWDTGAVEPGRHQLTVRATDATGQVQPEERQPPFPNGASGWHNLAVFVDEG